MHQQLRSARSGRPAVAAMTMTPVLCRNEVVSGSWNGPQSRFQARPMGMHCLSRKPVGLPPREGDSGSDCHARPQGHLACPWIFWVRREIHANTLCQVLRHRVRVFVQFWNYSLSMRSSDAEFRIDWAKLEPVLARSREQGPRCKCLRRNRKLQQALPKGTNPATAARRGSRPDEACQQTVQVVHAPFVRDRKDWWSRELIDDMADEPGACRTFCASCPGVHRGPRRQHCRTRGP